MADINKNLNVKVNWHGQKAKTGAAKLKGSVDNIGKATDKANKKSESFFKRMSTGAKLVAGYITGRVVLGIVNLGKKLVTAAGKYEQLNIAFETFIGDAKKAQEVIKELNRFAALTPFRTDQVNNAAKGLLAFGFTAEELIPTLKMLGDISAGTGKDLGELGIIFGQIKGAGRLMGQDLLQLISAGFNPLQVISQKTGRSMRDLKDDMSKGLISFKMVTQAFKDATSEGGRFFNLTVKQSKSFLGRLSTLQSVMDIYARDLGTKLLPAAGFVVEKLIKLFGTQDDLTKSTEALTNKTKRLAEIEKILKDNTKELSIERRALLGIEKEELALDIVRHLDEISKAYNENTKAQKDGAFIIDKTNKKKLETIKINRDSIVTLEAWKKEIKDSGKVTDELKASLIKYGIIQDQAFVFTNLEKTAVKELNKEILNRAKHNSNLQVEVKKTNESQKTNIGLLTILTTITKNSTEEEKKSAKNLMSAIRAKNEALADAIEIHREELVVIAKKDGKTKEASKEEIKAAKIKKDLITELLTFEKESLEELEGMSAEKLEKLLKKYKDNAIKRKKIIDELLTYHLNSDAELEAMTTKQLQSLLKRYEDNSEKVKQIWNQSVSAMSGILGRLAPGAKKAFDSVAGTIKAIFEGDIVSIVTNVINFVLDAFETVERREEQAAAFAMEQMEKVELKRAEMAVKALEDERDKALQRFLLQADNYNNMNQVTKDYYDLLMAKEKEKYDLMTADEKNEFDIKKKYTDAKLKVEKEYDEAIKKSNIALAKVQLKIALLKVESDRSEAEAAINAEYWAPWDQDKKKSEWQKMQGLYNDIKNDLESSMAGLGGLKKGGVIKGYGGGDRYNAKLEAGEAVLPKEWQINPIPFFSQLMSMRGATAGVNNNVNNMSSNQANFAGANFYFQGANAQEVIEELQDIADNTNTRIFSNT